MVRTLFISQPVAWNADIYAGLCYAQASGLYAVGGHLSSYLRDGMEGWIDRMSEALRTQFYSVESFGSDIGFVV